MSKKEKKSQETVHGPTLDDSEIDLDAFEAKAEAAARKKHIGKLLLIALPVIAVIAAVLVIMYVPFSGTTPEGLQYEYYIGLIKGKDITITGYEGTGEILELPNKIDGGHVVAIKENIFSGVPGLKRVNIATGAPLNKNLFLNCEDLRVVWFEHKADACELNLPDDCYIYCDEQDVGIGVLEDVVLHDDRISGISEDGRSIVLDVTDDVTELTVEEDWIYTDAFSGNAEKPTVHLTGNTMFDPELYDKAQWLCDEDAPVYSWFLTCKMAQIGKLEPDPILTRAARIRAEEIAQNNDFIRPDGTGDKELLEQLGIEWTDGTSQKYVIEHDTQKLLEVLNGMMKACKEDKCDRIAVATWLDHANDQICVYGIWIK